MVREPGKELRFTRAGQAVWVCLLGAVMVGVGVTLVATGMYRDVNPLVPHALWGVPFFVLGVGCFLLARHLTRHAYLILSPMGLEVFPFFRPASGMQLVMWQEVVAAEVDEREVWLTLHFNEERTAGIHLTMRPIRKKVRCLLAKAVLERVSGREK